MPISFLEQNQPIEPRLKARMFVREFASHRYGIFKESGFRYDYMYPPFACLPGLTVPASGTTVFALRNRNKTNQLLNQQGQLALIGETNSSHQMMQPHNGSNASSGGQMNQNNIEQLQASIRGFDEFWNECSFETSTNSGLPTSNSINCAPYLTKQTEQEVGQKQSSQPSSFNLMSSDPFSYTDLSSREAQARITNQPLPLEWRDLSGGGSSSSSSSAGSESVKWHFCGENFTPIDNSPSGSLTTNEQQQQFSNRPQRGLNLAHNQLATNKQNVMCNERSALDIIKLSEDFRRTPFR